MLQTKLTSNEKEDTLSEEQNTDTNVEANYIKEIFSEQLLRKYEFYNYNHAAEILSQAFPDELSDLIKALTVFQITTEDIKEKGGNESSIPPKFNAVLDPLNWKEIRINGDLIVNFYPREEKEDGEGGGSSKKFSKESIAKKTIANYIDGHNIDFLKGRVAIDVEWNSKDQTFDRDLFAMRTYYECDVISVGVIITRSEDLNTVFRFLGKSIKNKYGASTTWIGKLIPRLDSRRHGGCPILAIGIKPTCVLDWEDPNANNEEKTNEVE